MNLWDYLLKCGKKIKATLKLASVQMLPNTAATGRYWSQPFEWVACIIPNVVIIEFADVLRLSDVWVLQGGYLLIFQ